MAAIAPTTDSHTMDDHAGAHHGEHHASSDFLENVNLNRLGLWLFFISELFLFGSLLATRFYLWGNTRPELDQIIGLIVTCVLLLSSWSMNMAETAIEHDDRRTFMWGLAGTFIMGLIFLFGVMIFEWGLFPAIYEGHLKPTDGAYGAVVFAMTGIHALHVISGLILIAIVWNLGRQGRFDSEHNWGVESCAIYWHYVDLVWIFFYPALYLIGTVAHH